MTRTSRSRPTCGATSIASCRGSTASRVTTGTSPTSAIWTCVPRPPDRLLRGGGNYLVELEVTRDFERVCGFLGLSYNSFCAGFGSLSETFDWVIASPYFSVAPYLDEADSNLRRRARERTTVSRFIEHLRERGVDERVAFEDRRSYLPMIIKAFPEANLAAQIERERAFAAHTAD